MNWSRVAAVARWEYGQKVRAKSFIISLVLTPVIIVVFSVLPGLLASRGPDSVTTVAVVDSTGSLFNELKRGIESSIRLPDGGPAYVLVDYMAGAASFDSAVARADRDALAETNEGTLVLSGTDVPRVTYRSPNPSNLMALTKFERAIERINTHRRLAAAGIDTALFNSISQDIDINTVKVTRSGGEASGFMQTFFTAYAGCILLMFLVLSTGQSLVRSLVEEKSNRIMELLIGSCTPYELMWGKLIGLSGLGITQMLAWVVLALGAFTVASLPSSVSSTLVSVYAVVPHILTYMVLGYVFYSALFVGVGSLVTTEQEAQIANSYLVLLLVFPMAFSMVVIQNPDAGYIRALSYVPFLTPSMMMIRTVAKAPPTWEILATMGMMVLSTVGVVWAAGKVFRTAILLYGKRPSLGEIVRWFRAG